MRYWVIADGDNQDQWSEFRRQGIVRITGRQVLGDLGQYGSRDEIRVALKKYDKKDEFEEKNPNRKALLLFRFANEVTVGDRVFLRHGVNALWAFGVVEPPTETDSKPAGAYYFEKDHQYPHALKVRWLIKGKVPFPVKGIQLAQDFISTIDGNRLNILKRSVGLQTATEAGDAAHPNRGRGGTYSKAASLLAGNKLYLERAREAFPILVRQAHAKQTIFYSDLAGELNMSNPQNLNYVLGAIGRAIQELAAEWKQKIPPLQCIVVNKNTGIPGEGVGWFISDLKDFSKRTPDEKKQILGIELVKVFNYPKWESVLGAFGLTPLSTDPVIAALKAKAGRMGGIGEQEDHKNLKHYVANNPEILGLSDFDTGDTEYCFPSADRIDVVFRNKDSGHWVGVEVKGPSSPDEDIYRGLFQCVKYAALREAELKSESKNGSTRVVLVLSRKLPAHLKAIKNLLGVEVVDGVIVPQSAIPV